MGIATPQTNGDGKAFPRVGSEKQQSLLLACVCWSWQDCSQTSNRHFPSKNDGNLTLLSPEMLYPNWATLLLVLYVINSLNFQGVSVPSSVLPNPSPAFVCLSLLSVFLPLHIAQAGSRDVALHIVSRWLSVPPTSESSEVWCRGRGALHQESEKEQQPTGIWVDRMGGHPREFPQAREEVFSRRKICVIEFDI